MTAQPAWFVYYYDTDEMYQRRIYVLESLGQVYTGNLLAGCGWKYSLPPDAPVVEEAWWTTEKGLAEEFGAKLGGLPITAREEAIEQRQVTAQKRAKLEEMMSRMDWRDREQFERARANVKPNLDHDLFVVSMHVPIDTGLPPNGPATQFRMSIVPMGDDEQQLALEENEEEALI